MGHVAVVAAVLAIHAAHALAPRYPDGHLFVDLRGARPADALNQLLRALGVPGEQVPDDLAARAARYRSRLAGMRVVLVLDDAVALFTRTTGAARVAGEQADLVAEAVELCGRLPLAIRVAAARLRHRPRWTVASLVGRLRGHCLSELDRGRAVSPPPSTCPMWTSTTRTCSSSTTRPGTSSTTSCGPTPRTGCTRSRSTASRSPGDRVGEAHAGNCLALVRRRLEESVAGFDTRWFWPAPPGTCVASTVAHFGAALRLACVLGDRFRQVDALAGLGQARFGHGAPEQAVRSFTEALTLARAIGRGSPS